MSSYVEMSYYYDQLTADQPYNLWADIVRAFIRSNDTSVLDIGCGTGQLTTRLQQDAQVTGMDLSEDMLAVAAQKSTQIQWLHGDMTQFDLGRTYDIITILCDSLNYLPQAEAVQQTFNNVYQHLADDGTFIFDVHALFKMETAFSNETYTDETDDVFLVWDAVAGEEPYSVWHEMSFFVKQADGMYARFDETHYQRTYDIKSYIAWLKHAGFTNIETFYDFDRENQDAESDRLFFIVKK